MAKTIPMIITNNSILIKDKESGEFKTFTMPALIETPNIINLPKKLPNVSIILRNL